MTSKSIWPWVDNDQHPNEDNTDRLDQIIGTDSRLNNYYSRFFWKYQTWVGYVCIHFSLMNVPPTGSDWGEALMWELNRLSDVSPTHIASGYVKHRALEEVLDRRKAQPSKHTLLMKLLHPNRLFVINILHLLLTETQTGTNFTLNLVPAKTH